MMGHMIDYFLAKSKRRATILVVGGVSRQPHHPTRRVLTVVVYNAGYIWRYRISSHPRRPGV
jgi:hypothetical protein